MRIITKSTANNKSEPLLVALFQCFVLAACIVAGQEPMLDNSCPMAMHHKIVVSLADLSSDWVSERDLLVGKFTVMEKFLRYSGQSCLEWNSSRLPSASPKKSRNSRSTSSKVFTTRYNFGSGAEKTRLSLGLEASSFKSIKRVLFGNAADGSFLGIFPEFDQQTQLDLINVLRLFSESLEKKYRLVDVKYGVGRPSVREVTQESVAFGFITQLP